MSRAGYELAIHGLVRKHSELMRTLEIKRDELGAVQNDISAVERALDLLGFQGQLEQPRKRVLQGIRRELRRFILDELRHGEATSREIGYRLAKLEGKDPTDKKAIKDIVARVSKGITALVDKKIVLRTKLEGVRCRYRLASAAEATPD